MYNNLKKILTFVSLISLAISTLMLISGVLFGLPVFSNEILRRILFIMATFAIASGLALIELPVLNRKRILGIAGLALLGTSTLLALILFVVPSLLEFGIYAKATLSLTITSIIFIVIILTYSILGSSRMPLQIFAYICYSIFDLIIILLIIGVPVFDVVPIILFVAICILNPALFVALLVLSATAKKNNPNLTLPKADGDMITISKAEYEQLKQENEQLKAELESIKNNN